jgi:hypothetical protein
MSRIDPAFAYSQARLQARYGARPRIADWSHIAATADLGALLQVLRASPLAGWTGRLGSRPGIHEIEWRAREEWLRRVDEVALWQPEAWRKGIHWLRWIAYLPALQKLARGGRAQAWMRDDPVLGPIVAREPRERATALRRTPLAPLAGGFHPPHEVAVAWTRHWRQLWPSRDAGRGPIEALIGMTSHERRVLARLADGVRSTDALRALERRFQLGFRRHPLSPAAAVAYLGLLALDLRRMRGALATRALHEGTATP